MPLGALILLVGIPGLGALGAPLRAGWRTRSCSARTPTPS